MTTHKTRERKKPGPHEKEDGWKDPSASTLEAQLHQILYESYQRADASARATARLEYELARDLNTQQVDGSEEDLSKESAMQEMGSEFDHSLFDSVFSSLNTLKLLDDLISLLKLDSIRGSVLSAVIEDKFRSRSAPKPRIEQGQSVVGTDAEVLLHNIKRTVERNQRMQGGNGAKAS